MEVPQKEAYKRITKHFGKNVARIKNKYKYEIHFTWPELDLTKAG